MVYILLEDYNLRGENYSDIIGVVSSKDNAAKMIKDYFGDDIQEISHRNVEDSGVEWVKTLNVPLTENKRVTTTVTLVYYTIDRL